ncbi:uncharacterized protein LOC144906439 [Branchiostoma floridae x Branchiostoma belcheri]
MLCIALQRYFTICTNSTRLKSKQALIVMILLAWSVPILSFLPLYIVEEVKMDPKLKRCGTANSDKLWAKVSPAILNCIFPYIAALAFYILIQNHVRKSKNRVQGHAKGPTNRLAVQFSKSGGRGVAIPSTSAETDKVTKPVRNLEGVVWVGDENPSSSDDEPVVKPGKPKVTIVQVASAPGTGEQQGKKSLLSDQEPKGNEPDKNVIPTATIVSDQTGTNKGPQRAHAVPGNSSQNHNSAAERQITKMMMFLFAAYTLCNMPFIVMMIFSSKVPAEAFAVGQLLLSLNGVLNPIIYGVMNKNIRGGYKHIVNSNSMTVPNLLLKKKGLHLAHVNVCSLRNKTVDLEYLLSNNNVHIMGISETHLDASVRDGELQIPNYDIIRLDRNGRGGGVAFYIRNHIPYKGVT